jgi:hypothetical protein
MHSINQGVTENSLEHFRGGPADPASDTGEHNVEIRF